MLAFRNYTVIVIGKCRKITIFSMILYCSDQLVIFICGKISLLLISVCSISVNMCRLIRLTREPIRVAPFLGQIKWKSPFYGSWTRQVLNIQLFSQLQNIFKTKELRFFRNRTNHVAASLSSLHLNFVSFNDLTNEWQKFWRQHGQLSTLQRLK